MVEHTESESANPSIGSQALHLYNAVADGLTTQAHTIVDSSAPVGQRVTAALELGAEVVGTVAVLYGGGRMAATRMAASVADTGITDGATSMLPKLDLALPKLADQQVLDRAAAITGKIDSAVPLTDRAGQTLVEYNQRWAINDIDGMEVRVKSAAPVNLTGPTDLPPHLHELATNRPVAFTGKVNGYVRGDGLAQVRHADGSLALYRQEELEPLTIAADTPIDTSLTLKAGDKPITDLKIGDLLERGPGQYPVGVRSDWQEWHGMVAAEPVDGKSGGLMIPGGRLYQRTGVTLLGKDGLPSGKDPLDVQIGDLLDVSHPDSPARGQFRVTRIEGLRTSNTAQLLDHEYKVAGIDGGRVTLEPIAKPYISYVSGNGVTYSVPKESLTEPTFRKIAPFEVKPGDQVVAPSGARLPNYHDWKFKVNMQGRTWTVSGVQDNGVILSGEGNQHFLVPKSYLNTRTLMLAGG
jgi:hypothetical protein